MVYNVNLKRLLQHLKQSAKRRGLDFNLTESYLENLSFPITCPILHVPLEYGKREYSEFKPSIDRIDSTKGYVKGNIQILSIKANRAKNNLSKEELEKFALYYK